MAEEKTRPKGCLHSMFLGIGCGCIYPVAMLLLLALLGWFFLAGPLEKFTTPVELPQFAGPDQEDFWKLQEKRLDSETLASSPLILTQSEFNAYLNSWQIPPVNGFCLSRCRFFAGEGRGTFYLIGSGFSLRSLVIGVEIIRKTAGQHELGKITLNNWEIPPDAFLRKYAEKFIGSIVESVPTSLPTNFLSGKAVFDFEGEVIRLSGEY